MVRSWCLETTEYPDPILIAEVGLGPMDFDWSRKHGTTPHPGDIIFLRIPWSGGVEGGGKIKAEHDKEWSRRLAGTEL